jgi:hypothetical protein
MQAENSFGKLAADGFPFEWISAIIPVPIALDADLCGTAAFLKERVIV